MRRPYLRGIRVLRQQKGELARFAHFCEVHLRLEDGRPLVVEDFQKRMLADFFAGTTETVILVPKKNSKSTSRRGRGPLSPGHDPRRRVRRGRRVS